MNHSAKSNYYKRECRNHIGSFLIVILAIISFTLSGCASDNGAAFMSGFMRGTSGQSSFYQQPKRYYYQTYPMFIGPGYNNQGYYGYVQEQ